MPVNHRTHTVVLTRRIFTDITVFIERVKTQIKVKIMKESELLYYAKKILSDIILSVSGITHCCGQALL